MEWLNCVGLKVFIKLYGFRGIFVAPLLVTDRSRAKTMLIYMYDLKIGIFDTSSVSMEEWSDLLDENCANYNMRELCFAGNLVMKTKYNGKGLTQA